MTQLKDSLFSLLEKHQQPIQTVITIFDGEDASVIRKNYKENVHLRNIKDNAILAHVKGLPTTLEFVIHGDFNTDYNIINEKKEKEAIKQIIDGEYKLPKVIPNISAWKNLDMSKPVKSAAISNSQTNSKMIPSNPNKNSTSGNNSNQKNQQKYQSHLVLLG